MNKIPTAKEFYKNKFDKYDDINSAMIEFAKLHVQAALKEAYSNATSEYDPEWGNCSINKDSILSSYPLDKII